MKSLSSRAALYGLIVVLGLLSALPNVLPPSAQSHLPAWYSQNTLSLGLDLRGGSHLLLEADTNELLASEYRAMGDALKRELRQFRISPTKIDIDPQQMRLQFTKLTHSSKAVEVARDMAREANEAERRFSVSQSDTLVELRFSERYQDKLYDDALERSLEVVRRRLDETGLVEPSITRQGDDGILVQMPGLQDPQHIRQLLGTTAKMSFHWQAGPNTGSHDIVNVRDVEAGISHRLEKHEAMAGKHIRDAQMAFNPDTQQPVVNFKLDHEGARIFGEITRANIGRPLAIVLDGKVITAPVIRGVIAGGSGEISGSFTTREASDLALLLRAGALPMPLHVIEERTVGPDLGSDAIAKGVKSALFGAALVIAFMLAIYGRWGLIACVNLCINVALLIGILSTLGATLTLPGIAGIILTIGMAVDANILINERIREEVRRKKPAQLALREGFNRAYSTILDSNVTTLIAVSLLLMFGSGPVKGFATTIGIGLLTSMFTAIAVTRVMMEWWIKDKPRSPLPISANALTDTLSSLRPNFLRSRYAGLIASAVLSLASLTLFMQPGLKYGVDFTGGTVVEITAPKTSVDELRSQFENAGLSHIAIQQFGDGGQFLVRLPVEAASKENNEAQISLIKSTVLKVQSDAQFPRVDMVGPKVSGGFSDATILAILLAGAGMLIYLRLRFEAHFALAATITIALDLTKTIGFFALTGIEFNLTAVAALLALIGYSVNDKVVVFDRIRENLRITPDAPMLQLLNDSIAATLTRTMFTSVTTFLAILPMAIAGGSAVASFAQPMLFGIVIGTSSSILIASPILYFLGQRRTRQGRAQLRPTAEEIRKELELIP